jgi:hypothetical protein
VLKRWLNFVLYWFVGCLLFNTGISSANEPCITLNRILKQLGTLSPSIAFRTHDDIDHMMLLPEGARLGLTEFSANDLRALDFLTRSVQDGKGARRILDEIPGWVNEQGILIATEPVRLTSHQNHMVVRYGSEYNPYPGPIEEAYIRGLHTLGEIHRIPIPNLNALIEYWSGFKTGSFRIDGFTHVFNKGFSKFARRIEFPQLLARVITRDIYNPQGQRPPHFYIEPLFYGEVGISPTEFNQISIRTEAMLFPLHSRRVLLIDEDEPVQILYPFEHNVPIRSIEFSGGQLRPVQVHDVESSEKSLRYVPLVKWRLTYFQQHESLGSRKFKRQRVSRMIRGRGGLKTDDDVLLGYINLTFHAQEGTPRIMFEVNIRKKSDDLLWRYPRHEPGSLDIAKSLAASPETLLDKLDNLNERGFDTAELTLEGQLPLDVSHWIKYRMRIYPHSGEIVFSVITVEASKKQYVEMFRENDFQTGVSKQPNPFQRFMVALRPQDLLDSSAGDIYLTGDAAPSSSVHGYINEELAQRRVLSEVFRHLPFLKSFQVKQKEATPDF